MADPAPRTATPPPPAFTAWVRWFMPALVVTLVLDLATKAWVFSLDERTLPSWLKQHWNPGVAWSMFDKHPGFVAGLTFLLIPLLVVVWWYAYRRTSKWDNLAFGFILGGAIGNGFDRLVATFGLFKGVRDFIAVDLGFWPLHPWPTFNLADSGIAVGFVLLLVRSFAKPAPRVAAIAS